MKRLTLLLVIAFCSCKYHDAGYKEPFIQIIGGANVRVHVFDSCEYVGTESLSQYGSFLTHKGNCKYCEQRRVAAMPKPVEPALERYFLINYSTTKKDIHADSCNVSGYVSSVGYSFPNINDVEKVVYNDLPYKKSCYQSIVVNSIFEFKTKVDYENFISGHKRPAKRNNNQLTCK